MHTVTVTREMDHDVSDVWKLLDEFGAIARYNPGVESAEIVSAAATGMGAQRICHFYDGTSLKETIVRYEPGRGYSFDLSNFELPLKQATSHFDLARISNGRSRITVTLEFIPKFGPLGWVMGKVMMRPMLLRALRDLTRGLDDHMRTGAIVGKGGALLAPAA
ncbi:MAG: SRPBCC family protein [Gemmatimonadetes bacterium]|nr:SRPBCC family protein [Gemmatimonadota bacterium]